MAYPEHYISKVKVIKAFDKILNKVLKEAPRVREALAKEFLAETDLFEYARNLFEIDDGQDAVEVAEIISNMNCEDV